MNPKMEWFTGIMFRESLLVPHTEPNLSSLNCDTFRILRLSVDTRRSEGRWETRSHKSGHFTPTRLIYYRQLSRFLMFYIKIFSSPPLSWNKEDLPTSDGSPVGCPTLRTETGFGSLSVKLSPSWNMTCPTERREEKDLLEDRPSRWSRETSLQ